MTEIELEATRLKYVWIRDANEVEENPTEANIDAEQKSWDAVIDFVEANGLNYTKYDPRGLA